MTITVEIRDHIEPLVSEWEHLAERVQANPFLWPGWIEAWWRAFGTGRLQIFAAYDDDRLVGILPMHRFRGALGSTTNPHTNCFGFMATNESAVKQLCDSLFSQKARRLGLSYLSSSDAGVSLAKTTAEAAGYRIISQTIQHSLYIVIEGTTWDAYESGLGRNLRGDVRRQQRRLREEGRLTLEVFDGTKELDELLEEGFRIEGAAWKDDYGTSINARPATRRFYTEVAHWAAQRGWLRLAFLRLDGRTIAFNYCLEYNDEHYSLKIGHDPAYARFSPGKVLTHLMIKRAFSERLTTYHFLGTSEFYKLKWTSAHQELLALNMFAPTAPGSLDRALFLFGRPTLELGKSLARSSVVGERGRRLLHRGYEAVGAWFHLQHWS
jgi:CelD/BcsL family acetyltransferase involved in cellulose biosynthesis